ncbi:unnamed protein product [marine sediment metagenome]|uniref:Uncharacterized protein n=1 Tax=marine sediment metagenome TaxID=412755 RepID=X0XWM3_9ZZZZ
MKIRVIKRDNGRYSNYIGQYKKNIFSKWKVIVGSVSRDKGNAIRATIEYKKYNTKKEIIFKS